MSAVIPTSRITYYWGTPLTPERNLKVDSIDDFLTGYTHQEKSSFQYIKHALDIEIKVDLPQYAQDRAGADSTLINYLRVENIYDLSEETPVYAKAVYYFVLKVTPRAENTIILTCHMDTLNTYKNYVVGARTLIHRQHVDRFKWNTAKTKLLPIIDYVDEGVEAVLYKKREEAIPQFADQNWNLVYRNDDTIAEDAFNPDNPVSAWLCPDYATQADYQASGGLRFTPADLPSGYTFIGYEMNNNTPIYWKINDGTTEQNLWIGRSEWGYNNYYMLIHRTGTTCDVRVYYCAQKQPGQTLPTASPAREYLNISSIEFVCGLDSIKGNNTLDAPLTYPTDSNTTLTNQSSITEYSKAVTDIDRKDARLIKIIKLPFPPSKGILSGGKVSFENNFLYDHGDKLFKLQNESPVFDYTFTSSVSYSPFRHLQGTTLLPTQLALMSMADRQLTDPKIYHSAFYSPKFVYDSFSFEFCLELMDADSWRTNFNYSTSFKIRYVTSSTFNSKFLFIFPEYKLTLSLADYDNVLPVSRNNELPIFNSQYVTYLRTAYRYDLKNVQRTQISSALQGLGSVATGTMSLLKGNPLGFGAAAFGAINAVMAAQRAEDGLKSKLAQMENQAVSVGNADDIDLLMAYTPNGAPSLMEYSVSGKMETALLNLFHYCGYAQETSGIPDETSRVWFNFVQADLEIINPKGTPTWAIAEIKGRYAAGVTILHQREGLVSYDPDQKKENVERALLE